MKGGGARAAAPGSISSSALTRHAAAFRHAWAMRSELLGPIRLAEERAFLPAAQALQETPPHPAPRRLALSICAMATVAIAWSFLGQVDLVAVAPGRIVVSERSKLIQPLETSVVKAVHVKDGDTVSAGQLLVSLDATIAQADNARIAQDLSAQWSELLRARALLIALQADTAPVWTPLRGQNLTARDLASVDEQLRLEWRDINAKQSRLKADEALHRAEIETASRMVDKLTSTLPLAIAREQDFHALAAQGFVAHHADQDRTRDRIELEHDLATAQARLAEARSGLAASEQAWASYRAESAHGLRDRESQAELKVHELSTEAAKATQRHALTELRAPVAGTVQQLAIHTPGGVVTEAQTLLVLVPADNAVTAEVTLDNKDIGFVREGQQAEIKLETFPYARYGTVRATVVTVSPDAVIDEKRGAVFAATLRLERAAMEVDGRRVVIGPGMNVTAEVRTGRQRVIDFLLSPLREYASESLRER
ncbi:HlyD family type I secretion periplasmic adaptor subunit [Roseateles chitinivorans]|uniref:HlyD family type I secretion periplasmic adaptor subunit n=1 Tax=Roseateles chitinivorans TaxID=2917965 RepID=UPI003D66C138